jgi:hypothetical protein
MRVILPFWGHKHGYAVAARYSGLGEFLPLALDDGRQIAQMLRMLRPAGCGRPTRSLPARLPTQQHRPKVEC